jgi:RNA polymerase sigma-70 factor (ECF subfamily)
LFALIAEGNEKAFKELFHLYVPLMRRIIIRITKDEKVVPDLMQDVFLRIWLSRGKLAEIEHTRSYILQIAYHQSFNWLRQQKVRDKAKDRLPAGWGNAITNNTTEAVLLEDTNRLVRQAIDALPPQAKKIYRLSRDAGMSIAEIAAELQLSPQTIKNTLGRSLKLIGGYLETRGIYLPLLLLWYWFS